MKNNRLLFLISLIFVLILSACSKTSEGAGSKGSDGGSNASAGAPPLKFVSLNLAVEGPDNGWKTGKTFVGFLNAGDKTICSLNDYRINASPILKTKEGVEYPVDVNIGGKFSVAEDDRIPFSAFPPIPPGFKIYTYGKNDTYIGLAFRFAEAATPQKIEFSDSNLLDENRSDNLQTGIDLGNVDYAGEQMVYGKQPVKKLPQLAGQKIAMVDNALEASFTGKCFENERKNLISAQGWFAEVEVKNTDKFQEYRPKGTWLIGYYKGGRGVVSPLQLTKPGMMMNSVGPGLTEILTFPLDGTIVFFKEGCEGEYFVLDYSMCQ